MKLLMLCREPRLYSCQRLVQAAEKQGFEMDILDPNRIILILGQENRLAYYQAGERYDKHRPLPERLADYAGILGRFGASSTMMGCNVLRHFELNGVPVLNGADAFALARDKWQSLQVLNANGIPVPKTSLAGELADGRAVLKEYHAPIIIKTLSGAQGVGVMLGESEASAKSILDTLNSRQIPHLVQQFVPEASGQDIRAFVIGDRVVAAMQRQGASGDFRANIHQGGRAVAVQLTQAEQQLAIKSAQIIGLAVAGVDLIRSQQGTLVLEVNASPGLEMIEQVSGADIAEQMIAYLTQHIIPSQN